MCCSIYSDLPEQRWASFPFTISFFLFPPHTLPSTELTLEQCQFEPLWSTYLKRKKIIYGCFFSKYWIYTTLMHSLWLLGSADLETWIQRAHCKIIHGFFYCMEGLFPWPSYCSWVNCMHFLQGSQFNYKGIGWLKAKYWKKYIM